MLSIDVEDVNTWFDSFFKSKEFGEALGIVWRLGSVSQGRFKVRNKDYELVARYADLIKTNTAVYSYFRTEKNYTLWNCEISVNHPFFKKIKELGWTPIKEQEKYYPVGSFDEGEFVKSYIRLHHDLGVIREFRNNKEKVYIRPRFRIHGSYDVVMNINKFLNKELGITEKKVQTDHKIDKAKVIYFFSKVEIPKILDYVGARDSLDIYNRLDLGFKDKGSL